MVATACTLHWLATTITLSYSWFAKTKFLLVLSQAWSTYGKHVYLRELQSSIDRLVPSVGSHTALQDVAAAYLYQKGVDGDGKGSNPDQLENLEADKESERPHESAFVQHNASLTCCWSCLC